MSEGAHISQNARLSHILRTYDIPLEFWISWLDMTPKNVIALLSAVRDGGRDARGMHGVSGFTSIEPGAYAWLARQYPRPPPMVLEMRRARGRYPDCVRTARSAC